MKAKLTLRMVEEKSCCVCSEDVPSKTTLKIEKDALALCFLCNKIINNCLVQNNALKSSLLIYRVLHNVSGIMILLLNNDNE